MSIAVCDWRDAASYAWLENGSRRCFAWEWLRRTPAYLQAWREGMGSAPFGLLAPVNPGLDARTARPIWTAAVDRGVLVGSVTSVAGSGIDLSEVISRATVIRAGTTSHVLASDGIRSIRLDLIGDEAFDRPVMLSWRIAHDPGVEEQIAALAQFTALLRLHRFAHSLHPVELRSRRWILMLRAHDATVAGATLRDMVSGIFGVDTSEARWRAASAPWRLRAQRLRSGARDCLAIGPKGWLAASRPGCAIGVRSP